MVNELPSMLASIGWLSLTEGIDWASSELATHILCVGTPRSRM